MWNTGLRHTFRQAFLNLSNANDFFTWQARAVAYPSVMSRIALRLLLALCLILNGIGNAGAIGSMPAMSALPGMSDDSVPQMTGSQNQSVHADCGQAERGATVADLAPPSPPAGHTADCGKDYCAHGTCTCPCMHLAQAVLLEMASLPPSPRGMTLVATLALGHSTPVPLELIRPPIG